MQQKEVEVIINKDGTIEMDQKGWEGKSCDGAINDLIKSLGTVSQKKKKKEYFKKVKIDMKQDLKH